MYNNLHIYSIQTHTHKPLLSHPIPSNLINSIINRTDTHPQLPAPKTRWHLLSRTLSNPPAKPPPPKTILFPFSVQLIICLGLLVYPLIGTSIHALANFVYDEDVSASGTATRRVLECAKGANIRALGGEMRMGDIGE